MKARPMSLGRRAKNGGGRRFPRARQGAAEAEPAGPGDEGSEGEKGQVAWAEAEVVVEVDLGQHPEGRRHQAGEEEQHLGQEGARLLRGEEGQERVGHAAGEEEQGGARAAIVAVITQQDREEQGQGNGRQETKDFGRAPHVRHSLRPPRARRQGQVQGGIRGGPRSPDATARRSRDSREGYFEASASPDAFASTVATFEVETDSPSLKPRRTRCFPVMGRLHDSVASRSA